MYTVVFQMLDFYNARTDEGSLIPGVRDSEGCYTTSMVSWYVLGPKEMQYAPFNDIKANFDTAGARPKIIVVEDF